MAQSANIGRIFFRIWVAYPPLAKGVRGIFEGEARPEEGPWVDRIQIYCIYRRPMNNIKNIILFIALMFSQSPQSQEPQVLEEKQNWVDKTATEILKEAKDLDEKVLKLALTNYKTALDASETTSHILSIVDFSKESGEPRWWVLDLFESKVVFHELVAHGAGSGTNATATSFSNRPGSHQSSLGLFKTDRALHHYKLGPYLELHGLNKGLNDKVYDRGVIVHGAHYVSEQMAKEKGYVGRSFGCLSVRKAIAKKLIDKIKGGSLIFAYHPQLLKMA